MFDASSSRVGIPRASTRAPADAKSLRALVSVALAFGAVVFLVTEFLHYLLVPDLGRNTERLVGEAISALIVGCLAAMLFRLAREQHKAAVARLQVITEMNHHIRNALMPISLSLDSSQDQRSVQMILQGIERIEWALREILPRQKPLPELEHTRLLYFHGGTTHPAPPLESAFPTRESSRPSENNHEPEQPQYELHTNPATSVQARDFS